MNVSDDDLNAFRDDPVLRALTGPASPDELAGEEQILAAFRATPRSQSRRRFARRFGTGTGAVAVAFMLSGGVAAAAYTQSLPNPVQRFFHDVLGPLGVPAPSSSDSEAGGSHHGHHPHGSGNGTGGRVGGAVSTTPSTTPVVSVEPTASAQTAVHPTRTPRAQPSASASGTTSTPTGSPSSTPTDTSTPSESPTPSPSPSPSPAYGDPSTWTLSGSSSTNRVLVHGGVGISGRLLAADGRPIPDHWVALSAHVPGTDETTRIQVGNTDDDGVFSTYVSGLNHTTVFMLRAGHGVHSARMRVVVVPTLTTSETATSDGSGYDVTLTSDGADPGDTVVLLRWENGSWVQAGSGQLDSSGQIVFRVPKPATGKVRYRLRLEPSQDHAGALTSFVVTSG